VRPAKMAETSTFRRKGRLVWAVRIQRLQGEKNWCWNSPAKVHGHASGQKIRMEN